MGEPTIGASFWVKGACDIEELSDDVFRVTVVDDTGEWAATSDLHERWMRHFGRDDTVAMGGIVEAVDEADGIVQLRDAHVKRLQTSVDRAKADVHRAYEESRRATRDMIHRGKLPHGTLGPDD